MFLLTLVVSYIERLYRARLRRQAQLERRVANAQLQYYHLPTVQNYPMEVLSTNYPLVRLPRKSAVPAAKEADATRHSN